MDSEPEHDARTTLARELARRCSAAQVWVLAPEAAPHKLDSVASYLDEVGLTCEVYEPLGNIPLAVADGRDLAESCHAAGRVLIARNSRATFALSTPILRGADVVVERLGPAGHTPAGDTFMVGLARGLTSRHPALAPWLDGATAAAEDVCARILAGLDAREQELRAAAAAARAVAAYLACHPAVAYVRYPGLKADPSFEVATRALHHGFGIYVDWSRRDMPESFARIDCSEIACAQATKDYILKLEAELA